MRIFVLKSISSASINEFVEHWRPLYAYANEGLYKNNIAVEQFNLKNLTELFQWKNGMILSGKKEKSLQEKVIGRIELINKYKRINNIDLDQFNGDFSNMSAVWRIFLLHIICPNKFPIYDQHIHRTYNFINGIEWKTVKNTMPNQQKMEFYQNTYLQFINEIKYPEIKALDEAFFAFGQFLNTRNQSHFFKSITS